MRIEAPDEKTFVIEGARKRLVLMRTRSDKRRAEALARTLRDTYRQVRVAKVPGGFGIYVRLQV